MARAPSFPVDGEKLRKSREESLGIPRSSLASKTGVSVESVKRYEAKGVNLVPGEWLRAFGELLGLNLEKIRAELRPDDGDVANVDPISERRFFDIPTFDLRISAGGWTEAIEIGETFDPRSIDQGLFRIRLFGDSMTPDFPDGCTVEFSVIRPSAPVIDIGECYYVHRDDGAATFKQLKAMDAECLTLAALNKTKYPKPLVVARSEVVRIAVAINIIKSARRGGGR